MRDEQDAGRIRAVESREECLAKARGQNHQPSTITLRPGRAQGCQRLGLNLVRGGGGFRGFYRCAAGRGLGCDATRLVRVDPGGRQLCDLGPGEKRLESLAGGQKRGGRIPGARLVPATGST